MRSTKTVPVSKRQYSSNFVTPVRDDVKMRAVFVVKLQDAHSSEPDLSLQDREEFVPKLHRERQGMHIPERKRPKIELPTTHSLHLSHCLFERGSALHGWLSELFLLKQGKARAGALALRADRASSRATFSVDFIPPMRREAFESLFRQACEGHLAHTRLFADRLSFRAFQLKPRQLHRVSIPAVPQNFPN